ncbi:hypothetical protein HanRHA438_Chr15g0706411 [Helianthus annuus]|nr:hypothetical protein HanHA300_Chr15g0565591 [Helianthus annuus]KAJ0473132.1 hypothetical protein HanHA89_Chr15g0614871 [Helianthus annuus]KAJ0844793.1 hypothetical protein HanRHA438_Chr15g0706411 [Helianthus annuus]
MVQKCNNPVRHYKNNTQKTCSLRKLTQIQQYHHHFKPRNAVPPPPPWRATAMCSFRAHRSCTYVNLCW